ncbi:hypothetical protein P0136_03600 [Lentisphaerota bacterium ZTH]|nr:hypothetical protein JYG24_05275 [Lentisphaerota bacterium]WET07085.1 hypothetical protein P0136_03600 [Lentisphaerota bacterium ZTH]
MRKANFLLTFMVMATTSSGTTAHYNKSIPYAILQKSAPQKTFYLGVVKRGHTAKMGFLHDVQIEYVAPVNAVVQGKLTDTAGRTVSKGAVIAIARNKKQKLKLRVALFRQKKAKCDLVEAKRTFERSKRLYKQKVYSVKQFCDAETVYLNAQNDYEVARLEVEEARHALDCSILRAPFQGVVEEVFHTAGSTVESAVPVLRISVQSPVRIRVELPEALTRMLSVNDIFKVYPAGSVTPRGAWLDSKGIFSHHIELFTGNVTVPVGTLNAEQIEMPKVTGLGVCATLQRNSKYPLWVPASSLIREKDSWYVWAAMGQKACTVDKPLAKEFRVCKFKVEPADVITKYFTIKYQALKKPGRLCDCQVVVLNPGKDLVDGKKAVIQEYSWEFRPGDKVWVHIPKLADSAYCVPVKAIQQTSNNSYVYAVDSKNRAMPVAIKTGSNFESTFNIIGKGLKAGMKVLVPEKGHKIRAAQVVKLGRKVNLSSSK